VLLIDHISKCVPQVEADRQQDSMLDRALAVLDHVVTRQAAAGLCPGELDPCCICKGSKHVIFLLKVGTEALKDRR
jgi:hypothetical protein